MCDVVVDILFFSLTSMMEFIELLLVRRSQDYDVESIFKRLSSHNLYVFVCARVCREKSFLLILWSRSFRITIRNSWKKNANSLIEAFEWYRFEQKIKHFRKHMHSMKNVIDAWIKRPTIQNSFNALPIESKCK